MQYIKQFKNNIIGINLIGLIIGSALGVFVLSITVRMSFTINNNYQIIKASSELNMSARILNNFFNQVFSANGYMDQNANIININNIYGIDTSSSPAETRFYLRYSGGLNSTLLCSGQPVISPSSNPTFLRISLNKSAPAYTKCNDSVLSGSNLPPIVSPQQFNDFSLVAVGDNNPNNNNNITNIEINTTKVTSTVKNYGNNIGIKLAILLRSKNPVFNTNRTVVFTNFNSLNSIPFTRTDKYLYKLVVIQSPFFYTPPGILQTQQCDSSTNIPSCILFGAQ